MINNWAEDGEPRQDLPEDAVEEFKVTNAGSKAEFGLATGGVVQVVTKSGTNRLRGTAFEYFRNKSLNARGVFEAVKPEYRRHQFGGSAGGPIVRDRVHFFGAFERTDTDEFYTVNTGQPQFYAALEGTFPLPSFRNLYSLRGDWQMSNAQSVFARYLGENEKKACQGCGGTVAQGRDEEIPRRSVVAGHTWIRGARQLNDFKFQYAYAAFYGYPGGSDIWKTTGSFPAERISRSTRQYSFPSLTYGNNYDYISPESRWGFRDVYSLNFSAAQREGGRRVQLHAVRVGIGGQRGRVGHLHVLARSAVRPEQPGVDCGAHRRARRSARRRRPRPSATRRTTTSRSCRTTGGCCPTHVEPRPALRAAVRPGQRGSRSQRFSGHAAVRRCLRARRHEQLRSAHRRRLGRHRQRQHRRARRLWPVLRSHPHARHARRVPELQAVLDQHHQPGLPGSLSGPQSGRVHRHLAGAEHHRRRQRHDAAAVEAGDGRRVAAADARCSPCTSTS